MTSKKVDGVGYRIKTTRSTQIIIPADSVGTNELQDGSVTTPKLATNAVTTSKITNLSVTEDKLAANAVSTAKIVDANVTLAKLSAAVQSSLGVADTAFTAILVNSITTLNPARLQVVRLNSSGGSFQLTMPLSPVDGDRTILIDEAASLATNAVTVNMNGQNFLGNPDDLLLNLDNAIVELIYSNGNYTWR